MASLGASQIADNSFVVACGDGRRSDCSKCSAPAGAANRWMLLAARGDERWLKPGAAPITGTDLTPAMLRRTLAIALLVLPLAGCELFGGESAEVLAARKDAEGKAVGGACRHAARAIEDCFALNKRADKAAVFAGWREMNDYMRDNKVETVVPQSAPAPAERAVKAEAPA